MQRAGSVNRYPWLPMLAVFILAFVLVACGSSTSAPPAPEASPTTVETVAQEETPTEAAHADDAEHDHADDAEHAEDAASIAALVAALTPIAEGETLQVVATTSIVGDVVKQVGGEDISLTTLMPVGADPHSFEPTPQDVGTIADADVVFVNGFDLEEALIPLIENSGIAPERIIPVSVGVETIAFAEEEDDHAGESATGDDEHSDEEHSHTGIDPHIWMSPLNVMVWTNNIAAVLAALDPASADSYTTNAASYTDELEALDAWVQEQIAQIPSANRKLVTDHTAFGYFANEYGLEQIGAVVPSYSTLAEPSAQDLSELQNAIMSLGVPAIFVGTTVNPDLAEQVAADTGVQLLPVYTGSLSDADGPAATYLDLMRFNTTQFVTGLRRP